MQSTAMQATAYRFTPTAWNTLVGQEEDALLTTEERSNINAGAWFSSLSPTLRHDILRSARVKRYLHGELIAARDVSPPVWLACAQRVLRVGYTTATGKAYTLEYVEPGQWLGEFLLMGDAPHTHDIYAHGATTTLQIQRSAFMEIFATHVEFREALMRRQREDTRLLYEKVDDLKTLGLGARLTKTLLELAQTYGVTVAGRVHITLRLVQKDLAQLLGASRQQVNQQLKRLEEGNVIRISVGGVVIQDMNALKRHVQQAQLAYED